VGLGASFIKLAQVLATRSDFFSEDYLNELKELHDKLPPMRETDFDRVFNEAFDGRDIFEGFEKAPIASASIGQVHKAYLKTGEKVAVKLRRYGIQKQVKADIRIINFFNNLFRPLFSTYTRNSIDAVISEFSKMIEKEVSFVSELHNLKSFSQVYADSGIRFPKPFEEYCSDGAIVMSFEEGFRFDDKENLLKYSIDFRVIIRKLIDFYTDQMLIEGYFHADPHPGNLLVSKEGELILLDFGMVKRVANETRIAIIELIKAAHEQNYELYISANKRLGTVAYEAPTAELAEFTSKMFAIFSDENLSSETMQKLAFDILSTTKDLPFKLPSEAIYILRTSAIIEGLGTTYIENFNGIKDILPILQENIPKALGSKNFTELMIDTVKDTPFFIQNVQKSMQQISKGEVGVVLSNEQLSWVAKEIKEYIKSKLQGVLLIIISFFMINYDKDIKEIAAVVFLIGIIKMLLI